MDGINSDKVSINLGGSEGGGGGMGAAALVAALGQRNQGGDNAALIAALGQRNEGRHGDDGFGLGGGGGILGVIALLGLLRGRGGLGGDDGGCNTAGDLRGELLMSKLGTIEGSIPLAAANVENAVCRAEGSLSQLINTTTLAQLAATSGVKDAVVNTGSILLQSGNQNAKEILGAICALSSKIDQNQILDLQRQLGVAQAEGTEERHARRVREVEVNVTNTATAIQAQSQQQQQLNGVLSCIRDLANDLQLVKQGQTIFNSGTMAASGTQAAANTRVN